MQLVLFLSLFVPQLVLSIPYRECEIDLQEWDRATIVQMLEFLYRGSYKYPDRTEVAMTPQSSKGKPGVLNYGQYTSAKVTAAVALVRQDQYLPDVSCIPPQHGTFNGMTGDINLGRPGGYIYLVWKSVPVK